MHHTVAKPARILIAADQPLEALALEAMLREPTTRVRPYETRVTADAREILPLLDKWPYALLVLDLDLHPQSGLTALEWLEVHLERRPFAVLALAGADDTVLLERARNAGAAAVLTRPFTREETLKQVANILAALPEPSVDDTVLHAVQDRLATIT